MSPTTRSRLYLAAAAVLSVAVLAGHLLHRDFISVVILWLVMGVNLAGLMVTAVRLGDLSRRPRRFLVSPKGFRTHPAMPVAAFAPLWAVFPAYELGSTLVTFPSRPVAAAVRLAVDLVVVAILALCAIYAIGRTTLTLTPEGVSWGFGPFRRRVAWDELLPGGPSRPHPGRSTLRLAASGGRQRSISTQVDVHPWLLADAIRWYVEHPEHRSAIGTVAEHARLLRELGVVAEE